MKLQYEQRLCKEIIKEEMHMKKYGTNVSKEI